MGFEWPDLEGVLDKVKEEVAELQAESDPVRVEEEFGDVLFSLMQWARKKGVDPDGALRRQMLRFKGALRRRWRTTPAPHGGWEQQDLEADGGRLAGGEEEGEVLMDLLLLVPRSANPPPPGFVSALFLVVFFGGSLLLIAPHGRRSSCTGPFRRTSPIPSNRTWAGMQIEFGAFRGHTPMSVKAGRRCLHLKQPFPFQPLVWLGPASIPWDQVRLLQARQRRTGGPFWRAAEFALGAGGRVGSALRGKAGAANCRSGWKHGRARSETGPYPDRRPSGPTLNHTASAMALPMSVVLALPPMSGVRRPLASTLSMAAMTEAPASGQPRWSSIMAPAQIWPMGLAMPWP